MINGSCHAKSRCPTKRRMGADTRAHSSLGMIVTQVMYLHGQFCEGTGTQV